MRVVHVAPTPFGGSGLLGGGERYPLELSRALAGHVDTTLVTFGRHRGEVREPGGLRIRTLRSIARISGHPAHPLAPALPFALEGADVVHTHHLRSAPSRVAALVRRVTAGSTVATDHGLAGGDWAGLLPRLFDGFLTVSSYSARRLGSPADRTRVIYGGADPTRFRPDPLQSRDGVLFVGRITPHKGVDRLIRATPPGTRLRIAGSEGHDPGPPERDYPALLRRLASGREVEFLGPVDDDELPALLRSAAVLALPSVEVTCYGQVVATSELLGLIVLEAMATGTPVVASRIGGLPEVVAEGESGLLAEPGDVDGLRDALEALLRDPVRAEAMGRRGRERVLEQFTWEACARRCLDAYQEIGAPPRRNRRRGRDVSSASRDPVTHR